jgi:hypothetical protein
VQTTLYQPPNLMHQNQYQSQQNQQQYNPAHVDYQQQTQQQHQYQPAVIPMNAHPSKRRTSFSSTTTGFEPIAIPPPSHDTNIPNQRPHANSNYVLKRTPSSQVQLQSALRSRGGSQHRKGIPSDTLQTSYSTPALSSLMMKSGPILQPAAFPAHVIPADPSILLFPDSTPPSIPNSESVSNNIQSNIDKVCISQFINIIISVI